MSPGRRSWLRILLTGAPAALLLAACSTPAPLPDEPAGQAAPQHWSGRFSLTFVQPAPGGNALEAREDRAQGRFNLARSAQGLDLVLFSPFGQTLANASTTPAGAMLTTSQGEIYRADDPDLLVERALGWRLPVSALPGWLAGRGLPPGTESLVDKDWRVQVEERFESGQPRRLAARWPLEQRIGERRVNLFLIIDRPT